MQRLPDPHRLPMNLPEAANRLRILADAYHGKRVRQYGTNPSFGFEVSATELEAVTFAAAFLSVFVESLESLNPPLEV